MEQNTSKRVHLAMRLNPRHIGEIPDSLGRDLSWGRLLIRNARIHVNNRKGRNIDIIRPVLLDLAEAVHANRDALASYVSGERKLYEQAALLVTRHQDAGHSALHG